MGQIFICTSTSGGVAPPVDCPGTERHQPHPAGYVQHSEWAERALKVATQRQCSRCGLWALWAPRRTDLRISMWPEPCRWVDRCRGESIGERMAGAVWVAVCLRHAEVIP